MVYDNVVSLSLSLILLYFIDTLSLLISISTSGKRKIQYCVLLEQYMLLGVEKMERYVCNNGFTPGFTRK